ncbi:sodium:proton antiporter, partial [Candidatus Poribacteria bacterium]|nr:sodium:proton antiporter [Candidatus Poribacteria bacterium]
MKLKFASCLILCLILAFTLTVSPEVFGADEPHGGEDAHHGHGVDGAKLPLWWIIPFVGILLSIAIFPLALDSHFLVHHGGKMSLAWGLIFAVPYLIAFRGEAFYDILHIYLLDYIPFIILLWGLFTVAGGILVRGTLRGTPIVNTLLLLFGTIIASWVGTTGASMLLIRPLIRANAYRKNKVHLIVFFIFLVSNIGGSLTPIGDPPLFLGFLRGVPFFWTTAALLPHMLFISVILIVLFFVIDTFMFKREGGVVPDDGINEPIRIEGLFNLVFLLGVIGAVLMSGTFKWGEVNILGVHVYWQNIARETLIVVMGLLSLKYTPFSGELRQSNEFSWEPIE